MPSRQQLESALVGADAAGDVEAATALATALKNGQYDQDAPAVSSGASGFEVGLDLTKTIGSGIIAEPLAGLAGLGDTLINGAESGAATVDSVRNTIAQQPSTATGANVLESIADFVKPVTDGLAEGTRYAGSMGSQIVERLGGGTEAQAAADAFGQTIPAAIGALLGARPAKALLPDSPDIQDIPDKIAGFQTETKTKIGEKIAAGSTDSDVAGYIINGRGKVAKDPFAKEAIKQGFDEGVIAAVKGATNTDRANMLKMVDLLDKSRKNRRFEAVNRPSDVVGDSIKQRVSHIIKTNKEAGAELEGVANSLRGQSVDYSPAVDEFARDLQGMGIRFTPDNKLDFSDSDVQGIKPVENLLNRVAGRMRNTKTPDAHDVHRMKKFIDEHVTYGKNADGLAGSAEIALKSLRRNLDGLLDKQFPEYNRVNTTYSETIGALDALQDVAGRKMNLEGSNADKALGTLSRRVLSNAQSRVTLIDALDEVSEVAGKYGGQFDDDLITQVMFFDELNRVLPPNNSTTFRGEIGKETMRAVREGKDGLIGRGFDAAGKVIDEKVRGMTPDGQIESLRKLLQQTQPRRPSPQQSTQSTSLAERP